jgi:uncharacterized phage protein (TIGR01671 family)
MNREIKFRVWDVKNSAFQTKGNTLPVILQLEYNGSIKCDHKDFVFQQFTGLKDKNGKEIYEGDILNISRDIVDKARVVETESHVCEVYYGTDGFWLKGRFVHRRITDWETEVIGNIFENPELCAK